MSIFQIRLKNCIETIIENEAGLRASGGSFFDRDIVSLKSYLALIDKMELDEESVCKLENITSDFLAEMKQSSRLRPQQNQILQ